MPDTGRESFDITLPMQMGGQAFLRLPRSMNEREFDMLKTLIDVMLTNMKEALVTSPTPDPKNGP